MADLTPSEQAYFESGGKANPEIAAPAPEPAKEPPAPAAEPAKETPAAAPAEPVEAIAEPRQGEVPHAALHAAREAAKAAKAETAQARAALQQQADRLARIEAMVQRGPVNEQPLTLEQRLERQEAYLQQTEAQRQQSASRQAFVDRYAADAQAFAKDKPDFWDAYNHAVSVRRAMWEDAGITDLNEVNTLLEQEEAAIVNRAMAAGKSGPEALYSIAKRFGYQAASAAPAALVGPTAEERTAKATEAASAHLKTLAAGQKHEKSLANAPSAGDVDPSAEELLKLSDEEFEKMTRGKKWRKFGGG